MDENNKIINEDIQNLKRPVLRAMRQQITYLGSTVRRDDLVNVCKNIIEPIVDEPPIVNRRISSERDVQRHEMERIGDNNQPRRVTRKSSCEWCKTFGNKFKYFLTESFKISMLFALVLLAAYVLILICDKYGPNNPNRYTLPNIFLKFYEYCSLYLTYN